MREVNLSVWVAVHKTGNRRAGGTCCGGDNALFNGTLHCALFEIYHLSPSRVTSSFSVRFSGAEQEKDLHRVYKCTRVFEGCSRCGF